MEKEELKKPKANISPTNKGHRLNDAAVVVAVLLDCILEQHEMIRLAKREDVSDLRSTKSFEESLPSLAAATIKISDKEATSAFHSTVNSALAPLVALFAEVMIDTDGTFHTNL